MGDLISGFEQVVGSETSEKSTEVTRKSGKGQGSEEFQKAEFWVNVGVTSKNADGEEVFLSLPKGIALDGLKAKPVPNKASPFQAIRESEAALFDQLMKLAHSLKPGEVKNRLPSPVMATSTDSMRSFL